jgi:hypothetical protein
VVRQRIWDGRLRSVPKPAALTGHLAEPTLGWQGTPSPNRYLQLSPNIVPMPFGKIHVPINNPRGV